MSAQAAPEPLSIAPGQSVTVLTGAGVSVASGLRPYRGPGGLWTEQSPTLYATAAAMAESPSRCWAAHLAWARQAREAQPNEAHRALAQLERAVTAEGGTFTLLTQNVDGLHERAGSRAVLEVHGSLARVRCTDQRCRGGDGPAPEPDSAPDEPPECRACGKPLRYDVVLFEEPLSVETLWSAKRALRNCAVFLAVGTSGVVEPAAGWAREADYATARTVLVNLEAPAPANPYFHRVVLGAAESVLPALWPAWVRAHG